METPLFFADLDSVAELKIREIHNHVLSSPDSKRLLLAAVD